MLIENMFSIFVAFQIVLYTMVTGWVLAYVLICYFIFWWPKSPPISWSYHCYWFHFEKFRTSLFTGTKHPLVPHRVEFRLIPTRSGHFGWFWWVLAGIPIPVGIEIKPNQPILSQRRSPEETHPITAVFIFFFFSIFVCFIPCNSSF